MVAMVIALLYGAAEALARVGVTFGDVDASFPWGLLIVELILAAPKMLGRATAGKIWEAVANRVGGKP